MAVRPQAVAFDVLETLMNVEPLSVRFEDVGLPPALLQPWFLRVQRDCMALNLSGGTADFSRVARQALHAQCRGPVPEEDVTHVLEGFAELPAHGDAEPAVRRLRDAGVRVGALTVGAAETVRAFLERTGLAPAVADVVTAAEAGVWKPAPGIYHTAAERLGVPRGRMALVAVHAWDCHGAKKAGCTAGWCARLEGRHGDVFARPDVTGRDLAEVADGLLALPAG